MTTSTNMYALHEHGESHDETSENGSRKSGLGRVDNLATPEDVNAEEEAHDIVADTYQSLHQNLGTSL